MTTPVLRIGGRPLRDLPFLLIAAAYLAVGYSVLDLTAFEWLQVIGKISIGTILTTTLCAAVLRFGHYVFISQPERPIGELAKDFRRIWTRSNMESGFPIVFAMFIFVAVFVKLKAAIPQFGGFVWDPTLTKWDRTLHFGHLPWEWLQPILGHWPITFAINVVYQCWLLVMWTFWLFFAFTNRLNRTRFLISFALLWGIGGSLLAIRFASAGPCYYATLLGIDPDPYAPLMDYLRQMNEHVPVFALYTQEFLRQGYLGSVEPLGISAMPSLHNAIALLMVLASLGFNRLVRLALAIHAVVIFLGSVVLGWHYALDAYVAWALSLAVWHVVLPFSRWWDSFMYSVGALECHRAAGPR